eukprot:GEMP01050330.1.p1 GENE.GEMP01050330.1~~GEMP01050330.1.p1  ORF type:complete len:337 (+),score=79.44 GEMP01050330.1:162-1172(+)
MPENVLAFLASVGTDWAVNAIDRICELQQKLDADKHAHSAGYERLQQELSVAVEANKSLTDEITVLRRPFYGLLRRKEATSHLRKHFNGWLCILASNVKSKYYTRHTGIWAKAAAAKMIVLLQQGGIKKIEALRQKEEEARKELEAKCANVSEMEERIQRQADLMAKQNEDLAVFRLTLNDMELTNLDLKGTNQMVQANLDAISWQYVEQTRKLDEVHKINEHLRAKVKEVSAGLDAALELSDALSAKMRAWKQKAEQNEQVVMVAALQRQLRQAKDTINSLMKESKDEQTKRQKAESKLTKNKRLLSLERQFLPLVHKVSDVPIGHDARRRGETR